MPDKRTLTIAVHNASEETQTWSFSGETGFDVESGVILNVNRVVDKDAKIGILVAVGKDDLGVGANLEYTYSSDTFKLNPASNLFKLKSTGEGFTELTCTYHGPD